MNEPLHETSEEDKKAALKAFFSAAKDVDKEQLAAIAAAKPALERLCRSMRQRTDQSSRVRDLLYSAWNGQATPLIEVCALEWALKKDVCAVLLAFGCETEADAFYYDALIAPVKAAGLFEWFCAAAESGVAA